MPALITWHYSIATKARRKLLHTTQHPEKNQVSVKSDTAEESLQKIAKKRWEQCTSWKILNELLDLYSTSTQHNTSYTMLQDYVGCGHLPKSVVWKIWMVWYWDCSSYTSSSIGYSTSRSSNLVKAKVSGCKISTVLWRRVGCLSGSMHLSWTSFCSMAHTVKVVP